jgi:ferritin-like metal-binding protein YciE
MKSTSAKKTDQKSKGQPSEGGHETEMGNSALHALFIEELKDIYWAEKHLVKSLPKMAQLATSEELKEAIENHLNETEMHVTRLEKIFESVNEKASTRKCEAMAGLIDEANRTIEGTEEDSLVRDVAIISCAQKVEHYEIATYGTLKTLAQQMDYPEAVELFSATLDEEKNADRKLSEIALSHVNEDAQRERR